MDEEGKPWVEMGTWLKTTESPLTREMCSMKDEMRASRYSGRRGGAMWLLSCVVRERRGESWGPYRKRDDAYRLFPGFGFKK